MVRKYSRRSYRPRRKHSNFKKFARKVRSVITHSSESKFSIQYLATNFSAVGNVWVENNFVNFAQGDDIFAQRQGRRIAVTGFYLNGILQGGQSNLATDDNNNIVRLVGWVAESATPMATGSTGINDILTKRSNPYLMNKWMDRYINLRSAGRDSTGYMPASQTLRLYHKFRRPIIVDYSGTGTGTWNKAVGVSMISDSALAPSPGFVIGNIRFTYKDI